LGLRGAIDPKLS